MRSEDGLYLAAGFMSGTSRDGIDVALIETDGEHRVRPLGFLSMSYDAPMRDRLASACEIALEMSVPGHHPLIAECEAQLTQLHEHTLLQLFGELGKNLPPIDVIGFHGHTVAHRADRRWTWQIGDAQALANSFDVAVVHDMRADDVARGGEGAPLMPIFHRALFASPGEHVAVLNLGGVANLTWLGAGGDMSAFDCGMGNALVDDWVFERLGLPYDALGAIAARGRVDEKILDAMLGHPYFTAPPPKSLERADFGTAPIAALSTEDGAATLTAFTAAAVANGLSILPGRPERLIVAGGGRKNSCMMEMIAAYSGLEPLAAEKFGWDGDAMEAQGFAYMAVRRLKALPISFPGTTGVDRPLSGGRIARPAQAEEASAA